ncbi:hypothetical protein MUK42_33449 [Musa troglodytarum]|uniref:Uncharacterized protein n=1 Tax=Musa troglodytarum TaxID=320322 RepID=A0A9E7FE17_9LILI|nr:hypothetical protein MUK42_33449 [Musa troglodytarum]
MKFSGRLENDENSFCRAQKRKRDVSVVVAHLSFDSEMASGSGTCSSKTKLNNFSGNWHGMEK